MQEKKVIEFLIRNNGRIQIVMLCVLLVASVLSVIGLREYQLSIMLAMLIYIAFEVILHNVLMGNQIINAENDFYFYPSDSLGDMLESAQKEVHIVAVTGLNMGNLDILLSKLTCRSVKVNFLLCTTTAIEQMCDFSYSSPAQRKTVNTDNTQPQSTINRLLASVCAKPETNQNNITVKLLDSFMSTSFVAVDLNSGNGKIQCNFYQFNKDSHECPCIKFDEILEARKHASHVKIRSARVQLSDETINWYEYYKDIILDMWNSGEKWDGWKK